MEVEETVIEREICKNVWYVCKESLNDVSIINKFMYN